MEAELFSNLYIIIFFYLLGIAGCFGLIVLLIYTVAEIIINKKIKLLPLKILIAILLIFGVILSLPYYFTAIAYHQDNFENSEKYLFYAKNTAIIPSIKAGVYYQLRGIYQINHEGQKAIDAYEKAVKIAGHEDKLEKAMICIVYFAKPDREKIIQTCSKSAIAVDYIRTKEFDKALETINEYIKTGESKNQKYEICSGYAIRAAIYKQSGDKNAYKKDYDNVDSECSYYKFAKKYIEADNILDVYIKNKDKYKF